MPVLPRPADLVALQQNPAACALLDGQYRILATNACYRNSFHLGQEVAGQHCFTASHGFDRPCDEAGECCPLQMAFQSRVAEQMLHIHQLANGKEFVLVEITPICDEQGEVLYFREELRQTLVASAEPRPDGLVGVSPRFIQMLDDVHKVARSRVPVLLLGESGTGKELIARALHDASDRADKPFVPVECSGLSESLFESELFGHRKGAFTGALADQQGLVESVRGGTLFMDEMGDVPLSLQVKLLRLLESHNYRKVGETDMRQADFRLVCATHQDLGLMMAEGRFRADLYYRISTFPIHLPPLRERLEDIGLLARSILLRNVPQREHRISPEAEALLRAHDFPGNIRELVNLLERARILAGSRVLQPVHFPALMDEGGSAPVNDMLPRVNPAGPIPSLRALERDYLRDLLNNYQGSRAELAMALEISVRTLNRKMRTHGLS
jgi:two-component system response regulator HydG